MPMYWVLKTREDLRERTDFKEHWPRYKGERVIAIGWGVGPSNPTYISLRDYIKGEFYPEHTAKADRRTNFAVRSVWRFIYEMNTDDEVLLCQGYSGNQKSDVRIHGFARITGPYRDDLNSDWFQRKRDAELICIERMVPKNELASRLNKKALLRTVHQIDEASFERVKRWLLSVKEDISDKSP